MQRATVRNREANVLYLFKVEECEGEYSLFSPEEENSDGERKTSTEDSG
jgi:hypothetical protein